MKNRVIKVCEGLIIEAKNEKLAILQFLNQQNLSTSKI